MRLILAIQCIATAAALSPLRAPLSELRLTSSAVRRSTSQPFMMAKKKTKRKDGTTAKNTMGGGFSNGFGAASSNAYSDSESITADAGGMPQSTAAPADERSRAERVDAVLRGRGINRADDEGSSAARPSQPSGSLDPLARIPKAGQVLLERFFGGGLILTGTIFISSGIAVSVEALCKVLDKPLPPSVDDLLVNVVEPLLTPSILTLFFFSISLGLLKQLQFSSESAGVLYREEDE